MDNELKTEIEQSLKKSKPHTKIDEFKKWIELELNGYKPDDSIPDYRSVTGQIKAWNPYHGYIPIVLEEKEIVENLTRRYVYQSVGEIKDLLQTKNNILTLPYPTEIQALLRLYGNSRGRHKI